MKKTFYMSIVLLAILAMIGCRMKGGIAHFTFNNIGEIDASVLIRSYYAVVEPGDSFTFEVVWLGSKTVDVSVKTSPRRKKTNEDNNNEEEKVGMKIIPGKPYTVKDLDHIYIDMEYYPEDLEDSR